MKETRVQHSEVTLPRKTCKVTGGRTLPQIHRLLTHKKSEWGEMKGSASLSLSLSPLITEDLGFEKSPSFAFFGLGAEAKQTAISGSQMCLLKISFNPCCKVQNNNPRSAFHSMQEAVSSSSSSSPSPSCEEIYEL